MIDLCKQFYSTVLPQGGKEGGGALCLRYGKCHAALYIRVWYNLPRQDGREARAHPPPASQQLILATQPFAPLSQEPVLSLLSSGVTTWTGVVKCREAKNWILPKQMKAKWFFRDSHWLETWKNHLGWPSMGPNGGSVAAMDSAWTIKWTDHVFLRARIGWFHVPKASVPDPDWSWFT